SAEADAASYRFAGYVLHALSFPSQRQLWLCPTEHGAGAGGVVDADGTLHLPGRSEEASERVLLRFLEAGGVLYDGAGTRELFEKRLPVLASARTVRILGAAPSSPIVLRRPANEVTSGRVLRFAALLGAPVSLFVLVRRRLPWDGLAGLVLALSCA